MDVFDRAQELEQKEREAVLANHRSRSHLPSLKHCADCGDEIPEQRRALGGVRFCVECQKYLDDRQGGWKSHRAQEREWEARERR